MQGNPAFQDLIPNNHCFGCGPDNHNGLRIKSYWSGEDESVCHFSPASFHSAGPERYLNGGIIATVIDCHCVGTAIAKAYQMEGREIGAGETIWFVTGKLDVSYRAPVEIAAGASLKATVTEARENKISLDCQLSSGGVLCAQGLVIAVRVGGAWFE
ncbi:PaaI family thioesterase [Haliea sp. E17]|uniref:PaaI family thioesterase n=1 Tax=Haliea sp. E17 TaxID=3401576 RepID=UPI003AAF6F55